MRRHNYAEGLANLEKPSAISSKPSNFMKNHSMSNIMKENKSRLQMIIEHTNLEGLRAVQRMVSFHQNPLK